MPTKILIADDEPDLEVLIRQQFRKQIRDKVYDFVFAHDGAEALAKLQADPDIRLVLSDINMPVMDGLTFLSRLKDVDPLIQPVIVSAYGDLANIRTAMNRGAFDFLTKPIDFQDFEITLTKTLQQAQALRQAALDRDRLSAIERELAIATEIQQSILPRVFPPFPGMAAVDLHALMLPAREVGGDFYDFFVLDDDKLGLVIGDVSGKGVPAALFMAMSRTVLKAVASQGGAPGDCLTEVNRLLCRDNSAGMFVTLFYAVLDARKGELQFGNGGHNPPYLLRRSGEFQEVEITGDTVLAMMENLTYTTGRATLEPGDAIFLYTDGVTEAMDAHRRLFGEARLERYLREHSRAATEELVRGVVAEVQAYAGGAPQSDDLTALAARYRGKQ